MTGKSWPGMGTGGCQERTVGETCKDTLTDPSDSLARHACGRPGRMPKVPPGATRAACCAPVTPANVKFPGIAPCATSRCATATLRLARGRCCGEENGHSHCHLTPWQSAWRGPAPGHFLRPLPPARLRPQDGGADVGRILRPQGGRVQGACERSTWQSRMAQRDAFRAPSHASGQQETPAQRRPGGASHARARRMHCGTMRQDRRHPQCMRIRAGARRRRPHPGTEEPGFRGAFRPGTHEPPRRA
jgi:hypothetical protein